MRIVSDKCCREDQNTNFVRKTFPENRAVYEIMEKCDRDEQATDGNTRIIRCMRFSRWISKAANTRSEYVIIIISPRQPLTRKCLSVAFYVHCLFFLESLRKTAESFCEASRL